MYLIKHCATDDEKTSSVQWKNTVIDQEWATVNTSNIDNGSFLHNNEINVVAFAQTLGNSMKNALIEDLGYSIEMARDKWRQRTLADKLKEWLARRFEYWP